MATPSIQSFSPSEFVTVKSITYDNGLPFTIFEWKDCETNAIGWIAIDGSQPRTAGGGLFMSSSATLMEVCDIANTMSNKMCVSRISTVRGAKGGIRFDHTDPRAQEVLRRFFRDNKSVLLNYWGTGADLNTDHHVIDVLFKEEIGISTALYSIYKAHGLENEINILHKPLTMDVNEFFNLSEASVGYGAAVSLFELMKVRNPELIGKARVIIQGFGTVGSTFAYYLKELGIGRVVGIMSIDGIYVDDNIDVLELLRVRHARRDEAGLDIKSVEACLTPEQLASSAYSKRDENENDQDYLLRFIKSTQADVWAPCAGRYCLTAEIASALVETTFASSDDRSRFILAGANNVFGKWEEGQSKRTSPQEQAALLGCLTDAGVQMLPEWVTNSGTSCLFMLTCTRQYSDEESVTKVILEDIRNDITEFIQRAALVDQTLNSYECCSKYAQAIRQQRELEGRRKDLVISKIHHYHIVTQDLTVPLKFYQENMACEIKMIDGSNASYNDRRFTRQCVIRFLTKEDPFLIISEDPASAITDCGIDYLAFSASDIDLVTDTLKQNFVSFDLVKSHPLWTVGGLNIPAEDRGYGFVILEDAFDVTNFHDISMKPLPPLSTEPALAHTGIDHYTLIVDDADKVKDFHVNILGYKHINTIRLNVGTAPEGEHDMLNHVMGVPNDHHRVLVITSGLTEESVFRKLLQKKGHGFVHHIAHQVEDIEGAFEKMKASSYKLTMDQIKHDMILGLKQIFIADDYVHHFVELVERTERSNLQGTFVDDNITALAQSMNRYV
ncbi:hypothetical protein K493DRAFT_312792 [Basidiobolus meristosporus CBS 931.73]|uniref:VOC domain-containing protein n=1 Tax=Basidiobolus meristosporus CBS 931.73 TaxID=1314790 RepID=A0A1Y1YRD2_9FUNG|nr:hypothetical protein K493DRAFT_312792 [Basidiobolus meristosporus CBS 931.73]|eukprot:ORY00583.1 hypothetical protein K493DRAFT_312792 [Basidiobolus meristosporus CBS 931.73]